MALNFFIPSTVKKERNVKDVIVSILATEYPLTLRTINHKLKREFGLGVSAQAVSKAIKQLEQDKVIKRQDKEIALNSDWILGSKEFIDSLHDFYFKKEAPLSQVKVGRSIAVYTFNNLVEQDKFWSRLLIEWAENIGEEEPRINAWNGDHAWFALVHLPYEGRYLKSFKENQVKQYVLVNSDSFLDKKTVQFYLDHGMQGNICQRKGQAEKGHYIATFGNSVIECTFPEDLVKEMDEYFQQVKTATDFDLFNLMKIITKEREIKVTVIKSKDIAQRVNESILKQI